MIANSPMARRRVNWKLIGWVLLFFAFFFLLLEWQERDYAARGEIAEAVVTAKDIRIRQSSTGSGRRREHVISYRFSTPDGEVFEGHSDVLLETWNQTREGGPVTVEYKRDFPGTNRIAGQVAGAGFWWKAAAVLAMLGIASIIVGRRAAIAAASPQAGHLAQSAAPDRSVPSSIEAFRARNDQPAAALAIPSLWHLALRSPFMVYAILTAVGAALCLFSLPGLGGGADWLFAVVGVPMLGVGGYLALRDWKKLQADWQLFQHGAVGEATVTAVEQSNFSINRVKQWRISYSYADASGRSHSGRSYYLRPEDASGWQAGDTGRIRFDRRDPGQSVWTGRSA
jgi:hypothetical protein